MSKALNGYEMDTQCRVGIIGEKVFLIVASFASNALRAIIDVTGEKDFREQDVDFIIVLNDGAVHYVEVKTDTYEKTGNIFVEILSCKETGSIGCFLKTEARYLFYFHTNGELRIIEMQKFKEWLQENGHRYPLHDVRNNRKDGSVYHSRGYVIPKVDVDRLPFVQVIYPLKQLKQRGVYIPAACMTKEWAATKAGAWLCKGTDKDITELNLPEDARVFLSKRCGKDAVIQWPGLLGAG